MQLLQLIAACAPLVHPQTMLHVVQAESAGNPWAVNVNAGPRIDAEGERAKTLAKRFIQAGYTVDVGLAQINSNNFGNLELSVEQVFDPCTNLQAGARILRNNYYRAEGKQLSQGQRLDKALSYYNTGDSVAGVKNGYVERVRGADITKYDVPALEATAPKARRNVASEKTPRWDIFGDLSNKQNRWLTAGEGNRAK